MSMTFFSGKGDQADPLEFRNFFQGLGPGGPGGKSDFGGGGSPRGSF